MDELTTVQGTDIVGTANPMQRRERRVVMDVRAITKSLPLGRERIDILRGISFQIMNGDFVSIVGPSGSGKSTLLGIIAGLDNPTTGQVLIDDVDITRMSEGSPGTQHLFYIGDHFLERQRLIEVVTRRKISSDLFRRHRGQDGAVRNIGLAVA